MAAADGAAPAVSTGAPVTTPPDTAFVNAVGIALEATFRTYVDGLVQPIRETVEQVMKKVDESLGDFAADTRTTRDRVDTEQVKTDETHKI